MQGLSCQPADDLEVHRCIYHYSYMVHVVTRFLVGVIDGVRDDHQCLQFPGLETPKMVAPVRWCWCSQPVVSTFNSTAAPPAAGVRLVVPEASAKMTVLWLPGYGRRHGIVGW